MTLQTVTLTHAASGTLACLLPERGFNCFRWQVPLAGKPVELLWWQPGFETGEHRPSRSGIPLLFPFPGRIAGTTLDWQGQTYDLPAGDDFGNAIHGLVLDRPWRVLEQSETHAVGQFQASLDDPDLLHRWPADFRITATYRVDAGRLESVFLLENPDQRPLPCGFGTHGYFRLPLGGKRAEDCLIRLPVRAEWTLREMLPTGERQTLANAAACQAGRLFGQLHLDNVYTDLVFDDRQVGRAEIVDPDSGWRLVLEFNDLFQQCVVFTPPHREAICIEPYTCLPGAFHLVGSGTDTGIRVLAAGQSLEARCQMWVETIG